MALNYRVDASRAWDWWAEKKRGGGVLGAVGSHQVDMLRWWFGEIQSACGYGETFIIVQKCWGTAKG
jgi:predicted dehydrogenase